MDSFVKPMIESAVRMSLETVRVQHQLQVLALTRQIEMLERQLQRLQTQAQANQD